MQSAAHALATDAARVDYPPAHWKLLHSRLQMLAFPGDAPLRHTIAGLAFEAADQPDRAARCYARAAGQSTDLITNETTSRLRAAAMQRVRQLYDADLTGRRDGIWRQHATGNWQVLEVRRFRIHHRNDAAARRMAAALDFHFARIARRWSLDENEIPWSQPADIFLHADAKSFADATDQPPPVTAVSHIQMQGDRIIAKTIHAHQQDALLLSSSLAHELAHLATAELRRDRPLPAVIAEGLALDMEPACRHRQFARLFAGLPQPSPVARLLTANDLHPPETHFYAEAHRLVTVLRTRTSPAALIAMEFEAFELPRLATRCGFSDAHALQRAYHAARAQPRPTEPQRTEPRP